jgi:hypothetical protein
LVPLEPRVDADTAAPLGGVEGASDDTPDVLGSFELRRGRARAEGRAASVEFAGASETRIESAA